MILKIDLRKIKKNSFVFFLLTVGLLLICSGVFIIIFRPYDLIFKWKLLLTDDGEIFQLWERPPVNLYLKVYLWNITNHEAFISGRDAKLNIEEVGPYVYRELMSHENITFNDNGTLSAIPHHPLEWREELSGGRREDDIFYLPNIALLSIAHVTAPRAYIFRFPVNLVIRNTKSQPIVRMTAKEFMMGYESPLTTLGNNLLPHWIHFDKVGLIDRMYDFNGDFATFYTGATDIRKSGLYDTFHGSPDLPQWNGEHCSRIQGASDGTKFTSYMHENETLLFFRKSMCRPQRLKRVGEIERVQGLEGVRYEFEDHALDNGAHNELNKCFCRDGKCLPEGLVDVTDCYYGFPIALSYPHFLDADPALLENVTGTISPNRSLHESFFVVNPMSGLPLRLSAKFQINMAMSDVKNMAHVEKFSHLTIPMLWFEIGLLDLPPRLERRFSFYLNFLANLEKAGLYGTLSIGLFLSMIAVTRVALYVSKSYSAQQYNQNLVSNSVYNPCEVKCSKQNEAMRSNYEEDESDDRECLNIIRREDEYELENDDALSDIEYNEINDEEESTSSSEQTECEQSSEKSSIVTVDSSFVEIDLSSDNSYSTVRRSSSGYLEIAQALMGNKRDTLLKIVETDDDES